MKISKLLFALVLGAVLVSCGKHAEGVDKIPQSPRDAFDRGYPGATDVKWSADEHGEEFEVEFMYNYAEYEVTFDRKGNAVEIEYEIDTKFLPEGVLAAVEAKHPNKKIEASYVEHRRHGFYEVEVKEEHAHAEGEDHDDHEIEMYFTLSGQEFDAKKMIDCVDKCAKGTCEKDKNSCSKDKNCKSKSDCHKEEKKCCDKAGSEECCSKNGHGEHAEGEGHEAHEAEAGHGEEAQEEVEHH